MSGLKQKEAETMKETEKEHRLQQYLKWSGGWEAIYYKLTAHEREKLFDRLKERIEEFEKGEITS